MRTEPARIAFISGHMFGAAALEGILTSHEHAVGRIEIPLVLALHPKHSLSIVGYLDLVPVAHVHGLSVKMFSSVKSDQVYSLLSGIPHDYLLVIGLSQLVPPRVLDLPRDHNSSVERNSPSHGCIGMHPTLLPVGRGRAPIPWTILNGLRRSGVTAFWLEAEADAGAIIDGESFEVSNDETAATIFPKVAASHRLLGERLASMLATRSVPSRSQIATDGSIWQQRRPADGWLDFARSCEELILLIRATTPPYPGAFLHYQGCTIKVVEAECRKLAKPLPPGTILSVDSQGLPTIATSDGLLRIVQARFDRLPTFHLGDIITTSLIDMVDDG